MADVQISVTEADVQIAVIDQENTQLALAAPDDNQVNIVVPGVQGPSGTVNAAADGTAAAPGISFASDTNTGIYRPGADQLAISTGGVGRITIGANGSIDIDSSGVVYDAALNRLGINTASPQLALHCIANQSNFGVARIQNNSVSGYSAVELFSSAGTQTGAFGYSNASAAATPGNVYAYSTGNFTFLTGGTTERVRIDNSGRVGIGTTAPGNTLEVIGNLSNGLEGKGTINITSNTTTNNGFDASPSIGFSAPYSTGAPRILYGAVAALSLIHI